MQMDLRINPIILCYILKKHCIPCTFNGNTVFYCNLNLQTLGYV